MLLRIRTPLYATVVRSVSQGCMTDGLAKAVASRSLAGAVMAPVLPSGASLGWAPAAPDEWAKGRRLVRVHPHLGRAARNPLPHAVHQVAARRGSAPASTAGRCSSSTAPGDSDRERIAVIDAREAVAAGSFPGASALHNGPLRPLPEAA